MHQGFQDGGKTCSASTSRDHGIVRIGFGDFQGRGRKITQLLIKISCEKSYRPGP